jgi:DNA-binding NarL/FixJ family response regulator
VCLSRISVLVCDPQPIIVEGLKKVLAETNDLYLVGAVSRPAETLEAIQRAQPNVVLLDATAGLSSAFRLLSHLKGAGQMHAVLWVVDLPEMEAFRALQMGARGIIRKTLPVGKLVECLREVALGKIWMQESDQVAEFLQRKESTRLTPREKEVVRLICRGLRNRQIAENLHITPGTVKVHLMHIFEKTGLKDRLALAVHGADLVGTEAPASTPVSQ